MKKPSSPKPIPFIRKRCPHLKGKELLEAEELFREHLRMCMKIYYRLEEEERNRKKAKADQGKPDFDRESEFS